MKTLLVTSIFTIGTLAGIFVLLGVVWLWRRREITEGRRNPLTRNLLRSPGQSIREKLDDLRWDVATHLSLGMLPIPLAAGILLAHWATVGKPPTIGPVAVVAVFAVGTIGWFSRKLWSSLRELRKLRLGYDAELAVGQELNELLRHRYRVFHDFPVDDRKFNIDHVVVGPGGVFAVETKGRSKPSSRKASGAHWEVAYDGTSLQFPGWRETDPIRQTEAAARWLRTMLSGAVGEQVDVRPVLVIPGWYIKRTSPNGIPVLASGQIEGFFAKARSSFDDQLIQRIAYQLEQKCRDVPPAAFRRDDPGKS